MNYLDTLPTFLTYFLLCALIIVAYLTIYVHVTPPSEFKGIRNGNIAPSISLGGSLIGFTLPLISLVLHTVNMFDLVIWAGVATVVQLAVWFGASLLIPNLSKHIDENNVGPAIWIAVASISGGLVNYACLTY